MAFKNSLKQQSINNLLERKRKDQNGSSFSTMESCSSSRFSFQSGFNGNPSPSLRHIESFTDVEKQRTPQEISCQKSMQSFSDFMQQYQQEKEENCQEISELNDESFSSDDSDGEEHCIWDNSEAQEHGIDMKNFLNADGNAFSFYQLYSIRSQLYQNNRVLRSTTIQEVSNISKFYEKPIKLTDMMSEQTYLDNKCALFQQLPTLIQDQKPQTPTNIQQNQQSSQQQQQKSPLKESLINITCSNSRKQTEVKTLDVPKELSVTESVTKSIKINSINELLKPLASVTELPKQLLTTSIATSNKSIPVKTFSIANLISPLNGSKQTLTSINSNTELDISTQACSLTNIPIATYPKKLVTVSSQVISTPKKSLASNMQNSRLSKDNVSVERKNYLYKQSSKPLLTSSATRNTSSKKITFQSPTSQQQISSNLLSLNKSLNNIRGIGTKSPFSSPKSQVQTKRAYVVI